MHELTVSSDDVVVQLPSIAETAQLRRRGYHHRSSYRKNVCFITLNGSMNGWSFYNVLNGFGGF